MPQVVLITGASSGIGRALALEYASRYAKQPPSASNPSSSTTSFTSHPPLTPASSTDSCSSTLTASADESSTRNMRKRKRPVGEEEREGRLKLILALTARRQGELQVVKSEVENMYEGIVRVEIATMDVRNSESVFATFDALSSRINRPFDVVVVNAGVGGGRDKIGSRETFEQHRNVLETNTIGAFAVINAAVGQWKKLGSKGQVVGISSVASQRALPTCSGYSASKIALDYYLDALRAEVLDVYPKITVTTIHPGFVDTPITQDMEFRPFVITVNKAASIIFDRIESGTSRAFVPWPWIIVGWLMRWIPVSLLNRLMVPEVGVRGHGSEAMIAGER